MCEDPSSLTEDAELLVGLQGLLPGEWEIEPAGSRQVDLHRAAKDLQVGGRTLDGLAAQLHPHARHHHGAVVVDRLHREATGLGESGQEQR